MFKKNSMPSTLKNEKKRLCKVLTILSSIDIKIQDIKNQLRQYDPMWRLKG